MCDKSVFSRFTCPLISLKQSMVQLHLFKTKCKIPKTCKLVNAKWFDEFRQFFPQLIALFELVDKMSGNYTISTVAKRKNKRENEIKCWTGRQKFTICIWFIGLFVLMPDFMANQTSIYALFACVFECISDTQIGQSFLLFFNVCVWISERVNTWQSFITMWWRFQISIFSNFDTKTNAKIVHTILRTNSIWW